MISTMRRLPSRLNRRTVTQLADAAAWNSPPVQVTTLSNGVRVATMQTPSQIATTGIFIDAGVRSEITPGTAKIVGHLAATSPSGAALDSMGAKFSAEIGREQSRFMINGGDPVKSVDIIAKAITDGGLGNFRDQRDNILAKLGNTQASPREVVDDNMHRCAFRDSTLGHSMIGPFDEAVGLTDVDIEEYILANHTVDNTVVVATGPVNHADVVSAASEALHDLSESQHEYGDKPYFCGADLIYRNDEMGATGYLSVGFETVPWRSADAVTLMVMAQIIGRYKKGAGLVPGKISGNRCTNAIANKMEVGCADEFAGFQHFYRDTGVFGFYAACDEVAVEHCVGELMFATNCLSYSVTDEEVSRAKRELKTILFRDNSSMAMCGKVGQQMLALGRAVPAAEMVVRIDGVDAEEVKRVAWQYLNDAEVTVTGLGPMHGMPVYFDLRRMTTMYRY